MTPKIKSLLINTFGTISYLIVIFFFVTFILFLHNDVEESLKESWSVSVSFLSVLATLGTAIIAANLFNDWRDQHNKQVLAYEAKENFMLIHKERDIIHKLKFTCIDISQGKSNKYITWYSFSESFEKELLEQFNKNKDTMTSFCFLAHEQSIYNLLLEYRSEIEVITKLLIKKKNEPYSNFASITKEDAINILELLKVMETKNGNVLTELKTYIFVK